MNKGLSFTKATVGGIMTDNNITSIGDNSDFLKPKNIIIIIIIIRIIIIDFIFNIINIYVNMLNTVLNIINYFIILNFYNNF